MENRDKEGMTDVLLQAASYRNDESLVTPVEIRRGDKYYFTVHLRPLSNMDLDKARKKATKQVPKPQGRKLTRIEVRFDSATFESWLIYLATTEKDQKEVWGDSNAMKELEVTEPVKMIDKLLTVVEKARLGQAVSYVSGMGEVVER